MTDFLQFFCVVRIKEPQVGHASKPVTIYYEIIKFDPFFCCSQKGKSNKKKRCITYSYGKHHYFLLPWLCCSHKEQNNSTPSASEMVACHNILPGAKVVAFTHQGSDQCNSIGIIAMSLFWIGRWIVFLKSSVTTQSAFDS